jgi:hypothetical protein
LPRERVSRAVVCLFVRPFGGYWLVLLGAVAPETCLPSRFFGNVRTEPLPREGVNRAFAGQGVRKPARATPGVSASYKYTYNLVEKVLR